MWLGRRLDWHQRRLLVLVWDKGETRRKVCCELSRFNPVKLEFWKAVRFSSDELVDVTIVK